MESEPRKPCRVCMEEIREGAVKCIHCGSYQNWRRYLAFSVVVLSLLVALFSVLTVGAPIIKDTFTSSRPVIDVQVLDRVGSVRFTFLVSNGGKGAALIQAVNAPFIVLEDGKEFLSPFFPDSKDWPLLVEPQSFKIVKIHKGGGSYRMDVEKTIARYGEKCRLWIIFRDLNGRTDQVSQSCEIPKMR